VDKKPIAGDLEMLSLGSISASVPMNERQRRGAIGANALPKRAAKEGEV
jgi:hypothetical protein